MCIFEVGTNEGVMKDGICTCSVTSVSSVCCRRRTSRGRDWGNQVLNQEHIQCVWGGNIQAGWFVIWR